MDIHVSLQQTDLPISIKSVEKLVKNFLSAADVKFDEVSIHFIDTKTISKMHSEYFDDPTTTDCISFPMDDAEDLGYRVMGDVFVCPETALNYVAAHSGDVYREVSLYVIHGLLHLIGYDDIDEEDQIEMREAESHYLAHTESKKCLLKA